MTAGAYKISVSLFNNAVNTNITNSQIITHVQGRTGEYDFVGIYRHKCSRLMLI